MTEHSGEKRSTKGGALPRTALLLAGAVALLGGDLMAAFPAGAALSMRYGVTVTARSIETYARIPTEVNQGTPSSQLFLEDPNEAFCEAISGVYDLGLIVDEYASGSVPAYQNPTKVRVANPAGHRTTEAEFATFPGGPSAQANCPTPTKGSTRSTHGGYVSDQLTVESSTTETASERTLGENFVTTMATSRLQGIKVGDMLIRNFESMIKVDYRPDLAPVVSYRISLQGFSNGGEDVARSGEHGVVLSGQNVAGPDLAQQFNEQSAAHERDLEVLAIYGFQIVAPRYFKDEVQIRDTVEAAVLDGSLGFAAREGGIGQEQGMRLGMSRIGGRVTCCSPS